MLRMIPSTRKFGPYTVAMLKSVLPAHDAVNVAADIAGLEESPSHGVISDMLAFAQRESFNLAPEAPAVLSAFAGRTPDAPVSVMLWGVRCDEGTGLFYSFRHKNGDPVFSRQVVFGSEVHRTKTRLLTISGSHHIADDSLADGRSHPLVSDYCYTDTPTYTFATSSNRARNRMDEFPITDPEGVQFISWDSTEWFKYVRPGTDIMSDMLACQYQWTAGCAVVFPANY